MQVPFVVAKYAGQPELEKAVTDAIRVQQNNNDSAEFGVAAGKILEKVILVSH